MLNVRQMKHWKLSLMVVLTLLGLALVACVPSDLTANVNKTSSDVAALKTDVAGLKAKIDALGKNVEEPKAIERETKDQVTRGRADLLDYRTDYDSFKTAVAARFTGIEGVPAKKGAEATADKPATPDIPAKPGLVESQLSKLSDTLAGIPAKKGAEGKPDVPAKPGLLATKADVDSLNKTLSDLKTQLDRIEAALKK